VLLVVDEREARICTCYVFLPNFLNKESIEPPLTPLSPPISDVQLEIISAGSWLLSVASFHFGPRKGADLLASKDLRLDNSWSPKDGQHDACS
jgi:hypothetical protein